MDRLVLGKTAAEAHARGVPVATYGSPGALRRRLVALILSGTKSATASLAAEYEAEGQPMPAEGELAYVADDAGIIVAVTRTTRVERVRLAEVTWAFAQDEGEGFTSVADWRAQHEGFWRAHVIPGLPGFSLDDETRVICVWLEVLARLDT